MKPKFLQRPHLGILQKIKQAQSIEEIARLLVAASTCGDASESTMSRWTRAAEKRKGELAQCS